MKVDLAADVIENIFKNIKLSQNSSFQLLDQNNQVIYATKKISAIDPGQIVNGVTIQSKNDDYHVLVKYIPQTNWKLALLLSGNDIHTQTNTIYYLTALISVICILIAFAIFNAYSHRMVKPLQNIISTMKQIENGNLSVKANPVSIDFDFNNIAIALNHMIDKLNNHINNEYKAVIKQRNAEYRALQAQINPHFLYNTLNGLIALNRMNEKQLLEDSIIQLTKMFRYTCTQDDQTTVMQKKRLLLLTLLKSYERTLCLYFLLLAVLQLSLGEW